MDALRQAIKSTRSMHDLAEVRCNLLLKGFAWAASGQTL